MRHGTISASSSSLRLKLVFQMLLCLLPSHLQHSISFGCGHPGGQLSEDARQKTEFCHVFLGLPTAAFPSTTNPVHAITQSASPFRSTCPCHLSLYLLITSPIASAPAHVHISVLGCLSFRETPFYISISIPITNKRSTAIITEITIIITIT